MNDNRNGKPSIQFGNDSNISNREKVARRVFRVERLHIQRISPPLLRGASTFSIATAWKSRTPMHRETVTWGAAAARQVCGMHRCGTRPAWGWRLTRLSITQPEAMTINGAEPFH
jgi:hypothetical protein